MTLKGHLMTDLLEFVWQQWCFQCIIRCNWKYQIKISRFDDENQLNDLVKIEELQINQNNLHTKLVLEKKKSDQLYSKGQ